MTKPVDAFVMVNGNPSNEAICEDMLKDELPSPKVDAYIRSLGLSMGFSDADVNLFWN